MTNLTPLMLAEAFDCFWNAAIGSAHNRQSGMDAAAAMAAGMAAVATRLRELSDEETNTIDLRQINEAVALAKSQLADEQTANYAMNEDHAALKAEYAEFVKQHEAEVKSLTARAERAEEAFAIAKRERDAAIHLLRRLKAYGKPHTSPAGVTGSLLEFKSDHWFFISDKSFTDPVYRHKARGTDYVLLGVGKMQAGNWYELDEYGEPVGNTVDMRDVAIYYSMKDGSLWARPFEEFKDGRFIEIKDGG